MKSDHIWLDEISRHFFIKFRNFCFWSQNDAVDTALESYSFLNNFPEQWYRLYWGQLNMWRETEPFDHCSCEVGNDQETITYWKNAFFQEGQHVPFLLPFSMFPYNYYEDCYESALIEAPAPPSPRYRAEFQGTSDIAKNTAVGTEVQHMRSGNGNVQVNGWAQGGPKCIDSEISVATISFPAHHIDNSLPPSHGQVLHNETHEKGIWFSGIKGYPASNAVRL